MDFSNTGIKGLSGAEILASRKVHGTNQLQYKKSNHFSMAMLGIAKDPMVILLLVAASIYFLMGEVGNGIFLGCAILFDVAISLFQDARSRDALDKLKDLSKPSCKVIRDGIVSEIKSDDLVLGDSLIAEEGSAVAADGTIVYSNDFSVNESILTGESMPINKDKMADDHQVFSGTTVTRGLAIVTVTAIGNETRLGKIGKSLENIKIEKTPLEIKIGSFVKWMVIVGAVMFAAVWGVNFYYSHDILKSLIKALTLAMSIMPEEIPVALTTFMALGAFRLMKMGIVVKEMKTVETLGSATVICTDKTGTITENKMTLAKLYDFPSQTISEPNENITQSQKDLVILAMWASEPVPFDPMEIALHEAYSASNAEDERPNFKIIHEYPLDGQPPMMTHVYENKNKERIIAAKGAPEALMAVSELSEQEKTNINNTMTTLSSEGYRLLGVGEAKFENNDFPTTQQELRFKFKGLVAFYDPPKKNMAKVLQDFYKAGITVKIITGDNAETTAAIAKQIGFKGVESSITGADLMLLTEEDLKKKAKEINLFTRMFPDAKLKIINALKAQNEIVAMTGDGVNDGPALKAAHIGIAMGKKGTEIAKQAASLILSNDDFSKMVDAVAMGRRIYTNLKKAIQYILSIHIPIILIVFVPLVLGWAYPNLFSPIHVIFLELIMGPTCSIIYENEPIEKNTMSQPPRPFTSTFFMRKELITSIVQGLVITAGALLVYQVSLQQGQPEPVTRTMVFLVLITSNIFLTLINRSFYYSILTTLKYKNNLVGIIIGITVGITALLLYINPLTKFFQFERLTLLQLGISIGTGFVSVIWFEGIKVWKRLVQPQKI